jgi:transposase InsO family protein
VGLRSRRDAAVHPSWEADPYVESFNGKFRDECLNEHWFVSLADAKTTIEQWRVDYNTVRPHSSLNQETPDHFARTTEGSPAAAGSPAGRP